MKKSILLLALLTVLAVQVGLLLFERDEGPAPYTSDAVAASETRRCVQCHTRKTPSIVASWRHSSHANAGVGCFECHQAKAGEADAFMHFDTRIAVIVSPADCRACHQVETDQFLASHHAKGGEVLGSLDNYLGEVVEGMAASVSGCQQCHGSKVHMTSEGTMDPATFPNFGIGRINPDGTAGACSACHSRHDFSLAQARTPETCGRCHLGPDHPQKEVYESSKHAIAYRSHLAEMNLAKSTWIVGVDYSAGPVCATCHVSATPNQARTHDIGTRLSWDIRAAVSRQKDQWEQKRKAMQEVCMNCHNTKYVQGFYSQFDAGIELYNRKFALPAKEVVDRLRQEGKIDTTPFNEPIDWAYYYLWHHEGRRARNGLAMMGPDYVQWHGFYDIAERFYIELIPEAERLLPGVTAEIMARPEHKWFRTPLSAEERERIRGYYGSREKR